VKIYVWGCKQVIEFIQLFNQISVFDKQAKMQHYMLAILQMAFF
jgi:hypothetical protein